MRCLYSSQNKNIASQKCAEAANTLSVALADEITGDYPYDSYPEIESHLYKYLRFNIGHLQKTWPYYDPKGSSGHTRTEACRYFVLMHNTSKYAYDSNKNHKKKLDETNNEVEVKADTVEGFPGKIVVCIYWKLPEGTDTSSISTLSELPSRDGIRLVVEVTCESGSQSYTTAREYLLEQGTYALTGTDKKKSKALVSAFDNDSNKTINPSEFSKAEVGLLNADSIEKWTWHLVVPDSE